MESQWRCTVGGRVEDGDSLVFAIFVAIKAAVFGGFFRSLKNYYFESRFLIVSSFFFVVAVFHSFSRGQSQRVCTVVEVWECFHRETRERSHTLVPAQ